MPISVGPTPLLDQLKLLGEAAEVAQSLLANDDEVLDPHPELTGQIDPRLDRDDLAGLQHVVGAARQTRALVHLESDTVAKAVPEALAVPGPFDELPRGFVDVLAARA